MKKVLLGGVALITLGLVGSASAADMPVKAPVIVNIWDGFYLGVNAGAGFLQNTQSFVQDPGTTGIGFDPVSYNGRSWGFAGGLHGGYNFALPPGWLIPSWLTPYGSGWVIGVEADWDKTEVGTGGDQIGLTFAGARVGQCFQVPFVSNAGNCQGLLISDNLNWTASIRGRLGWTLGSMMLYGTGGAAWASEELSGQIAASGSPAPVGNVPFGTASILTSGSHTSGGWVAGGGVEFMATPAWIVRLEYLHYQFHSAQNTTVACSACIVGVPLDGAGHFSWTNNSFDVIRAGLSYKFNPGWWANYGF
jgi:outer membrane immunogenic protein